MHMINLTCRTFYTNLKETWVPPVYSVNLVANIGDTTHGVESIEPIPDSQVHGANMGPTWVLSAPDGPHVGPMNLAIRDGLNTLNPMCCVTMCLLSGMVCPFYFMGYIVYGTRLGLHCACRHIKVAEDDIAFKLAILKKALHLNDNTCFCSIIQSSKLVLGS